MNGQEGGVREYIASLQNHKPLSSLIVHHHVEQPRKARFGINSNPWPQVISNLLINSGIQSLYSHQVQATDLIRSGKNVITTTSTASGKSLVYLLPILEQCIRNRDSRSLCMFPLKALANDQKEHIDAFLAGIPEESRPEIAIYDGDTTSHFRKKIRENPPNLLITNPDMLHLALLPYNDKWSVLFSNLDYVVLDETHVYKGIFGSHIAQVIRRLKRICMYYGSKPQFIMCSATISNAGELAGKLTGESVEVVDEDASPKGEKHIVFINPMLGMESQSSIAIQLLNAGLHRKLRTIVYTQSRKMTELLNIWASRKQNANRVSPYRAGYLPEDRRDIEYRMMSGDLLAVISTSALELGIDIGDLDICLLMGYPGSVISTIQRGGRVGRKLNDSLVLLVGGEDALDQYYMRNPEKLFARKSERIIVNEQNSSIVQNHLICAAAEKIYHKDEVWHEFNVGSEIQHLVSKSLLLYDIEEKYLFPLDPKYSLKVNLRGVGVSISIIDSAKKNEIGQIDYVRALKETHPGAVYLHQGKTYICEKIDFLSMKLRVTKVKVDYHTRLRTSKTTEILEIYESEQYKNCVIYIGKVKVTEHIVGYEKRSNKGGKLLQVIPLDLPDIVTETDSIWFQMSMKTVESIEAQYLHFMGGIHAIEHAMIGILPAIILVDRNDLGGISIPLHEQLGCPAVFIYEGYPGSLGYVKEAYTLKDQLLVETLDHVSRCECDLGCPACIQSPKCGSGNRPLDKKSAIHILKILTNNDSVRTMPQLTLPIQMHETKKNNTVDDYLVMDLETQYSAQEVGGWKYISKMKMSVGVIYESKNDFYHVFTENEINDFIDLLFSGPLVVGFNIVRFDYTVLQYYTDKDFSKTNTFDILQDIYTKLNYRLSLDHLASETLGAKKSADGLLALEWWKQGRIDDIIEYCKKDVEITNQLYLYGLRNKHVVFRNKAKKQVRLPVDW